MVVLLSSNRSVLSAARPLMLLLIDLALAFFLVTGRSGYVAIRDHLASDVPANDASRLVGIGVGVVRAGRRRVQSSRGRIQQSRSGMVR